MANPPVQIVPADAANKVKIISAFFLILISIFAYYFLFGKSIYIRFSILIAGIFGALVLALSSSSGRKFIEFSLGSIREGKKVVWPTHAEARQVTLVVFSFVALMAIFLWGIDKLIEFVLYALILNWKL